jgi:UDP-GlcNAc3NAcA epimerase
MHIFTIVGARPQFVKAAPLSAALRQHHHEFLVHTGQHYDAAMSDIFFQELAIPTPDVNLGVGSGTHAEQTAAIMVGLEKLMIQQQPDWVLVYGDTNSTLGAALAASKLNLPIAHVEAGLRSYNRTMPEEVNRVLTDHVSRLKLCPTQVAVDNLAREGITEGVVVTGDIMLDAVQRSLTIARQKSNILERFKPPYLVVTLHRPANTDDVASLTEIMRALERLQLPVIFPIHPRTTNRLAEWGLSVGSNVKLIEPLGYLDMLVLVEGAAAVITDSGGLQKEAYFLYAPCVTIRPETEWVETVASGWNRLCAPQQSDILAAVNDALVQRPAAHPDFYGDGSAAARIVEALESSTQSESRLR